MSAQHPRKPHFYLRGISGETLTSPIHIHFDSFKSLSDVLPSALSPPNHAPSPFGTFLVTLTGPNFFPTGMTCRVSGLNFRMSPRGVVDSVLARVSMVIDLDEEFPIEPVQVFLREDGNVFGVDSKGNHEVDLDEVYFSFGDTVRLDGDGNPFDEPHRPRPTARQRSFMERVLREDKERIIEQWNNPGAA